MERPDDRAEKAQADGAGEFGNSIRRSAKKAARGRSMKARPTQSRRGVKGGLRPFSSAPCRVKGKRPLWGLGQRPNCWSGDQYQESCQQRRRQQSVPASNFARPQTRPQASLANYYTLSRQMGATTPPACRQRTQSSEKLGRHRTTRRRVCRCLFRHLRHANFSIYRQ